MNTKTILGISLIAAFAVSMIFAQSVSADPNNGNHLDIKKVKLDVNKDGFAKLDIHTKGKIPVGNGAFGYGVITAVNSAGEPENVLAATSHVCAADSPVQGDIVDEVIACDGVGPQGSIGVLEFLRDFGPASFDGLPLGEIDQANDGPDMHPHILDLTAYSTECSEAISENELDAGDGAFEVDVGRTLSSENNISPAFYDVKVKNKKLTIKDVPVDENNLLATDVVLYASFNILPLIDDSPNGNITNLCLYDLSLTEADDHGKKHKNHHKHK